MHTYHVPIFGKYVIKYATNNIDDCEIHASETLFAIAIADSVAQRSTLTLFLALSVSTPNFLKMTQ